MAQDYSEYLAINVLNEQQIVSYRLLSRALKVHVNLAKQMLYEFHRKQNTKKPDSIHATYLLTGTRTPQSSQANSTQSQDGDDTIMQSSPLLPGSSAPKQEDGEAEPTPVRSVLLVKEEQLEQARATFDKITGIHVYSLQSGGVSDIQSLTECNRKVAATYASEDPLQAWKQYGTIQNPNVKRRTQKRPPSTASLPIDPAASKKPTGPTTNTASLEKHASKASNDSQSAKATPEPDRATTTKKAAASKPAPTKRQSSDIFKSFAKGANKPKKPSPVASAAPSPAPAATEDESMGGMSDDEPNAAAQDAEVEAKEVTGKMKKDRQAELAAMMDVEDEPMDDPAEEAAEENAVDASQTINENSQKDQEPKETMTVENGRRRGRRRIMKKKTVKDDEGYLVTREEAAWESFSEEEPAPKKAKMAPAPVPAKGAKKGAAKPGQGNIMSFFGKK